MDTDTTETKNNGSLPMDSDLTDIKSTSTLYIEDYNIGIKCGFAALGVISFVTSTIAIMALRRTRKTPPSVRFLATALLSIDSIHIIITTARKFVLHPLYNTTLHTCGMISVLMAFTTVGIMTVERFCVFQRPMTYIRVCTQNFLHVISVTVWVSVTLTFLFFRYVMCYIKTPSIDVFQAAGFCNQSSTLFYFGMLCTMLVMAGVCYVRIFLIVREKNSQMSNTSVLDTLRSFKSTSLVFVYLFVIICTTAGFLLINISVRVRNLGVTETRISLDTVSVLNSLVDPFLYVLWFKECQMEVLKMFAFLNEGLRTKVVKMRMEIFDIIPYTNTSKYASDNSLSTNTLE